MEEKRKYPRFDTENGLAYEAIDKEGFKTQHGMGKTLDISQGGLLMETPVPVRGKFILLTSLNAEEELIQIKGERVFFKKVDDKVFHTGIRFVETDKKIRSVIHDMITVFCLQKGKL